MASHHAVATIRARSLANVLDDLKEARRDVDQARDDLGNATLGMAARHYDDLQDRATEAETRLEDLRDEFAERFTLTTGLTIEDFRSAYSEALI